MIFLLYGCGIWPPSIMLVLFPPLNIFLSATCLFVNYCYVLKYTVICINKIKSLFFGLICVQPFHHKPLWLFQMWCSRDVMQLLAIAETSTEMVKKNVNGRQGDSVNGSWHWSRSKGGWEHVPQWHSYQGWFVWLRAGSKRWWLICLLIDNCSY